MPAARKKQPEPKDDDIESDIGAQMDEAEDDGMMVITRPKPGGKGGTLTTKLGVTTASKKAGLGVTTASKAPLTSATSGDLSQIVDTYVYRPGRQDQVFTRVNGVDFHANKEVRIARNKTIEQLIRQESQLPDGSIVSRAVTKRIPMYEVLRQNHMFEVNGSQPQKPEIMTSRLPADANSYRSYAIEWIAKSQSAHEMEVRWEKEQSLRDRCGIDTADLMHINPFFEARFEDLKGLTD